MGQNTNCSLKARIVPNYQRPVYVDVICGCDLSLSCEQPPRICDL